jgi:PAS domain S-box-containing protein
VIELWKFAGFLEAFALNTDMESSENTKFYSLVRLFAIGAAGLVFCLGFIVLAGWQMRVPALIQVHPAFVPMQFNTALGFALCGAGLLALVGDKCRVALACGAIVTIMALATLAEYGADINFGIDQLLMDHYITVKSAYPGRMAVTTALSFVLSGIALAALGVKSHRGRMVFSDLTASIVLALGLGTFFGYLLGTETPYGWSHLTYMAVHTAAGFVVLGIGILSYSVHNAMGENFRLPGWVPIPVGVCLLTLSLGLSQALVGQERIQIQRETMAQMENLDAHILETIDARTKALERMAARWEMRHGTPQREWDADAARYVNDHPGYLAIEWVDPTYRVRWKNIVAGNQAAPNPHAADRGKIRTALDSARDNHEIVVSEPEPLAKGKLGFRIYVPLFSKGGFDGFLTGVFSVNDMIVHMLTKETRNNYAIRISTGNREIFSNYAPGDIASTGWVESKQIGVHNRTWNIAVQPRPEYLFRVQSVVPNVTLVVGLIVTILTMSLINRAQTASRREQELFYSNLALEARVEERTDDLNKINQALTGEITERKAVADALRENERLLRAITDNSPSIIYLRDINARILKINKAYERFYGVSQDEALGEIGYEWLDEAVAERLVREDREVLSTGVPKTTEFTVTNSFGEDYQKQSIKFPVLDEEGAVVAVGGITTDVTEHRKREAQLRQAQKMEAVGQLTGGIAHEFNNLLMVIVGNLEIAMDGETPERKDKSAALAMKGAMRAAELTNQLLAFSRKQNLQAEPLDLNMRLRSMQEMLQRTLGETISIETRMTDDIWPVLADGSLLESTLLNLSINARDAMPGGGLITITTSNQTVDEDTFVGGRNVAGGDYVVLEVADTGSGMTPEVIEHAFEPFFTTKDVGKGTGLGLSMIQGFVEQSGGFVHVESAVGQGTRISLYLPRTATSVVQSEDTNIEYTYTDSVTATVLVVEDDPGVREIVVGILQELGCGIVEADNGKTALSLLAERQDIDVLFTDVVLPGGISGPDIIIEARKRKPDIKVILTSGYPDGEIDGLAADGEQPLFIRKPYRQKELAKLLQTVLHS